MDLNQSDRVASVGGAGSVVGLGIASVRLAKGPSIALTVRGSDLLREVGIGLCGGFGCDQVWALRPRHFREWRGRAWVQQMRGQAGLPAWGRLQMSASPLPAGSRAPGAGHEPQPCFQPGAKHSKAHGTSRRGSLVMISSLAGIEAMMAPLTHWTPERTPPPLREAARILGAGGVGVNLAPADVGQIP
jgi:hypothetical protein